jgi:hypothetical protein
MLCILFLINKPLLPPVQFPTLKLAQLPASTALTYRLKIKEPGDSLLAAKLIRPTETLLLRDKLRNWFNTSSH